MIDVYLEKSPAALKVPVMLEECGIPYRMIHVSVSKGHQHRQEFRAISPNGKVPGHRGSPAADGGSAVAGVRIRRNHFVLGGEVGASFFPLTRECGWRLFSGCFGRRRVSAR